MRKYLFYCTFILNIFISCTSNKKQVELVRPFKEAYLYELNIDSISTDPALIISKCITDTASVYVVAHKWDSLYVLRKDLQSGSWQSKFWTKKSRLDLGPGEYITLDLKKEWVTVKYQYDSIYTFNSPDNGITWFKNAIELNPEGYYSQESENTSSEIANWFCNYSADDTSFKLFIRRLSFDGNYKAYETPPIAKDPGKRTLIRILACEPYLIIALYNLDGPTDIYKFNHETKSFKSIASFKNMVSISSDTTYKNLYLGGDTSMAEDLFSVIDLKTEKKTTIHAKDFYKRIIPNTFLFTLKESPGLLLTRPDYSNSTLTHGYLKNDFGQIISHMPFFSLRGLEFSGTSLTGKIGYTIPNYQMDEESSAKLISVTKTRSIPVVDSCFLYRKGSDYFFSLRFKKNPDYFISEFLQDGNAIELGASNITKKQNDTIKVSTKFSPSRKDSLQWTSKLYFDKIGASAGNMIALDLYVKIGKDSALQYYPLENLSYKAPGPLAWMGKYSSYLTIIAAILLFYSFFVLLLFFRPISLLSIYNSKMFSLIDQIPKKYGGGVIRFMVSTFFEKWFINTPRIMDAWVEKNKGRILEGFSKERTVEEHPVYVPLPVIRKNHRNELMEEYESPAPASFSGLFKEERSIVEIIGGGGLGKTTLAIEIAKWMTNKELTDTYFKKHLWLPILIEEEIKSGEDLLKTIKRKITSLIPEVCLTDSFLKLLLEKQRILVLVDALSEKSTLMIDCISKLHGNGYDINAMIITSRSTINLEIDDEKFLHPMYLNNSKLAYFIEQLLEKKDTKDFLSRTDKAELLSVIIKLFEYKKHEFPISPILVEMALESVSGKIKEEADSFRSVKDIRISTGSLYLQYIMRVNKDKGDPAIEKEYESVVKYLAMLSLGDNFIPNDIQRKEAVKEISTKFNVDGDKLIDKCIQNSVIKESKYKEVIPMIRFLLDPVSEYLCAFYYAEEYNKDLEKWKTFYAKLLDRTKKPDIIPPYGFIQAMLIIHEEFKIAFHIPPTSQIPSFTEVENILLQNAITEVKKGYSNYNNSDSVKPEEAGNK